MNSENGIRIVKRDIVILWIIIIIILLLSQLVMPTAHKSGPNRIVSFDVEATDLTSNNSIWDPVWTYNGTANVTAWYLPAGGIGIAQVEFPAYIYPDQDFRIKVFIISGNSSRNMVTLSCSIYAPNTSEPDGGWIPLFSDYQVDTNSNLTELSINISSLEEHNLHGSENYDIIGYGPNELSIVVTGNSTENYRPVFSVVKITMEVRSYDDYIILVTVGIRAGAIAVGAIMTVKWAWVSRRALPRTGNEKEHAEVKPPGVPPYETCHIPN